MGLPERECVSVCVCEGEGEMGGGRSIQDEVAPHLHVFPIQMESVVRDS